MAEYIDRKAVLSAYKQTEIDAIIAKKSWPDTWKALGENLKSIPAVDVVRCKDCKRCAVQHNHITLRYQLFCTHGKGYPEVSADDFCSYGERKDNERKAD